jgi:hypothetical protein
MGDPDPAKTCTSHVERANLTIRRKEVDAYYAFREENSKKAEEA